MEPIRSVEAPTWPPRELSRPQGAQHRRGDWYRQAPWPTSGELEYVRLAVTTGLLLLALPWLVKQLLTRPDRLLSALGQRAVK